MNERKFTELVCKALSEGKQLKDETVTETMTPFLTEVAAWAKQRGFEIENTRNGVQIYLEGKFVAMIDESGMMGCHPFNEAFELFDEVTRIKNRISEEDMESEMQINM